MRQEGSTRREFLRKAGAAALAGGLGYAFLWEPSHLELTSTIVPIRGLPKPFEGFRIAVLSDFHFGTGMTSTLAARASALAMSKSPDLILLPGDFFNAYAEVLAEPLIESFTRLSAPHGVFAVTGNHDHWTDATKIVRFLQDHSPVRVLNNESALLMQGGEALALAGSPDLRFGAYRPEEALGGLDPETPRIFLQHQPDAAEELPPGWRVDLQISGHMHGGQNALLRGVPGYLPSRYGSRFLMGLCQGASHRVFVTRGIGGLMPGRPRILCRPEVSLLTLVPAVNSE